MLAPHRTGVLSLALTALLALSSTSCGAVLSGTHDTQFHFLVEPQAGGNFSGWTEITLGGDISSVGTTKLWAISLVAQTPPEADLSFLSPLKGEAVTATGRTPVATLTSFPPGEQTASMQIVYFDDLHPLFKDASTIRIEWTGATNPAFTQWPTGGIWMQGDVTINVE